MADVKVVLPDGREVQYKDVPDSVKPDEVLARVRSEYNVVPTSVERLGGADVGVMQRIKNVGTDLARGAGGALDFMSTAGQVLQNPAMFGHTQELGARNVVKPREVTGPVDNYVRAATEGAGGAMMGPGGFARPLLTAGAGALSGLGGRAGSELTGGNPIAEIIGSLAGGSAVGVGQKMANMRNAPALAKEMLDGIDPATLDAARQKMVQIAGLLKPGINLSQAMNTPSKIDDVVNALARDPQGAKIAAQLREQPEVLRVMGVMAQGGLPGSIQTPQTIADRSQSAATATIQAAKGDRTAQTSALFEKAPPIPVQVGTQMANVIQAEQFKPGTSVAARSAMESLVQKLMPPNQKTIAPQDIHTAIREFRAQIKGTPLAPGDSKDFGQMSSLEGKLREMLNNASPSTGLGNLIFKDVTDNVINPLRKGVVGQVAGVTGSTDDKAAAGNKLAQLLERGTPDSNNSAITTFELATRKSDPQLFQDAVKTHIASKLDGILPDGNRVPADFAAQVQNRLAGTPSQQQGLRDMLAGVARSQGVPEATVVNGFMKFIDASVAAARRPGQVSTLSPRGIEEIAGAGTVSGVLGSVSPGRQAAKISGIFSRDAKRTIDGLLTTPEGLDTLRKLAKVDSKGPQAQILLSTFLGGLGQAGEEPTQ